MDAPQTSPSINPEQETSDPSHVEQWKSIHTHDRELERMHSGTPIQCQFCIGNTFRRSRLRSSDIPDLLLMRYPVRCTRCAQRQTASFIVAGVSAPPYLRNRNSPPANPRSRR